MVDAEFGGIPLQDETDANMKYTYDPPKRRSHYMFLCKVRA